MPLPKRRHALYLLFVWAVALLLSLQLGEYVQVAGATTADHLMCGWTVQQRPQTVSVDPDLSAAGLTYDDVLAAMGLWNNLFIEYYGFPIFVPYSGDGQEADVLMTAHGGNRSWVQGVCDPSFQQRGSNHTTIFLGSEDAWRNRQVLPHELGHALGFADHGSPSELDRGHIGFRPCGNYIGVMSYCASPQSWFLDSEVPGFLVDGDLVRDYFNP